MMVRWYFASGHFLFFFTSKFYIMNLLRIDLPSRYHDYGLLILRLVFGFSMIYGHGFGKLMRLFGAEEISFADPFGLGPVVSLVLVVFAEVICSLLVMAGLFTRAAVIPLIFTMATAFFAAHFDDPFGRQEKVILFGFAFLCLFFTGPGRFSLDAKMNGKKPYIQDKQPQTVH
jgi:putative oxidoreductase